MGEIIIEVLGEILGSILSRLPWWVTLVLFLTVVVTCILIYKAVSR